VSRHLYLLPTLLLLLWTTPLQAQDPGILTSISSPLDDHHYLLLEASDWTTAENLASSWGGNLVAVGDQLEMEFIHENFSVFAGTGRRLWLGLNDIAVEGVFEWTNGEPEYSTEQQRRRRRRVRKGPAGRPICATGFLSR